jgi:hypothetical protein
MSRHFFDTELIEFDGGFTSVFAAEGDAGWVVGYNGAVRDFRRPQDAFEYLQGLRKHPSVPLEHRAYVKNLARRLFAHLQAHQGVQA